MDNIKGIILQNGTFLISGVEEMFGDPSEPDCRLIKPAIIDGEEIRPWIDFTTQEYIVFRSSNILSIVDLKPEYIQKYNELF